MPKPPQQFTQESAEFEERPNIFLRTPEMQRAFGDSALTREAGPAPWISAKPNLRNILQAGFETEASRVASQEDYNRRITEVTDQFRPQLAQGLAGLGRAAERMERAGPEGAEAYQRGRSALADSLAQVSMNAAGSIQAAADSVRMFREEAERARSGILDMNAEVQAQIKDQTARRMVEVGDSVVQKTSQAVGDYYAEAMAAGVPVQQALNTVAQIQADGAQQLGNLQLQVGMGEDMRATEARVVGMQTMGAFEAARVGATAQVAGAAAGEVGATLRDLSLHQVNTGKAIAALEESHAAYQANVSLNSANLHNMYGLMAMDGTMLLADLVGSVELPIVNMAAVMEPVWSAFTGMEMQEYNGRMAQYAIEMGITDEFINGMTNTMYRREDLNIRAMERRTAQRQATQGRIQSFFDPMIETGASAAGSYISRDVETGNIAESPAGSGGGGGAKPPIGEAVSMII